MNKYERVYNIFKKHVDFEEGSGSSDGSTEPVIADTQTVVGDDNSYYALTPTNSYSDPTSYVGKTVQMEIMMDEFSVLGSGVIEKGDFGPHAMVYDHDEYLGQLNLENNRLLFMAHGLEPGQELTIKVSIVEEDSGSSGGLVVHVDTETNTLDKTWREINSAMAGGTPVMIYISNSEAPPTVYQVVSTTGATQGEDVIYMVDMFAGGSYLTFVSNSPTGYPVYQNNGEH